MTKPKLEQGVDYERGFIDGMQHQMQSSVDKACPTDEPVGIFAQFTDGIWREVTDGSAGVPLYTALQRTWVGLTEEERDYFTYIDAKDKARFRKYADYIEAKLKDKNT